MNRSLYGGFEGKTSPRWPRISVVWRIRYSQGRFRPQYVEATSLPQLSEVLIVGMIWLGLLSDVAYALSGGKAMVRDPDAEMLDRNIGTASK